jgi:simple sugar transport system substrate-binding protein
MKRFLLAALLAVLAVSVGFSQAAVPDKIAKHTGPVRVAVIRNLGSDDNTNQFVEGAKSEGKALGFQVDVFLSGGDDAKFQDFVNQAITLKYDGIVLSHGRDPYSTDLVKRITAAGIAVSVFDTAVNGTIPGATVTSQDDKSLAEQSLNALVGDFKGKANIIKLWVAGFPAMERRQPVYKKTLDANPGIKELANIGAVSSDVPGDTANKVSAILAKYPKGQIDAIWGSWDAFAQGAYKALKENGRTEIKIYSIDVSNQDLQLIQEKNSPWQGTVAVDPKLIGRINLRLVAKKIAGEPTPDTYEFKANLIRKADLDKAGKAVNVLSLAEIIPGWGQSDDLTSPWFATLKTKYKS